jgi:N-acetylglucosaminyl-diphospho-decaprenol L-rhamnosyltransferase
MLLNNMKSPLISISVVSHGQMSLVSQLMQDLTDHCRRDDYELILTLNLAEQFSLDFSSLPYAVKLIRNEAPLGFGANHNQAFFRSNAEFFAVVNPDIRFNADPFQILLSSLDDTNLGLVAPLVLGEGGQIEDSARRFPNVWRLLGKLFGWRGAADYPVDKSSTAPVYPDWVGGMFMVFPHKVFKNLGGFDESYFLYYEDVDICARLKLLGQGVALIPSAQVVHVAQRSSHRNFRYLLWHVNSVARFFLSPVYRRLHRLQRS